MEFKQTYQEMLKGKKIKRPGWGGYWFIEDGKVKIKLKTGEIIENDFNQETITNTLADDWEVVKEENEKKKWWKPSIRDKYYYISSRNEILYSNYANEDFDHTKISIGNCFQTEEQAKFMIEKLKVIHELEKFAYENNEEEINWSEYSQHKYTIIFDHKSHDLGLDVWCVNQDNPFNVYFTSKEIAINAIKKVGKDRIKKYYFNIKEE